MNRSLVIARFLPAMCLAFIVGCAVQQVRQLDDFKQLSQERKYGEIASQEVSCSAGDTGCDQTYLIHGMACYQVAKQASTAAKSDYQCAIDDLRRGLELSKGPQADRNQLKPYSQALLESIRERQDLSASWDESAPYTALLTDWSSAFRDAYPDAPDGYYYGATASLLKAQELLTRGTAPDTACHLLVEADQLIVSGMQNPGGYQANFEQTGRQVKRTLQSDCQQ